MVISGLVVTLAEGPEADEALEALALAGPFTLGERFGRRQAAVLETDDGGESVRWHGWAERLPGVVCVDVRFASVEEQGHDRQA